MIARKVLRKSGPITGLITGLTALLLTGCSSANPPEDHQERSAQAHYLKLAPAGSVGQLADDPRLQPFELLFSSLDKPSIEADLDEVYAESLFFNDTFHSFSDRSQLKRYLLGLADISETRVTLLDSVCNGNDCLIRWTMHTRAKAAWKTLDIDSIGMSHLRFDEQDKIILHQDYWDAAGGFYEHLPILGASIKAIRSRLK